MSSAPAQLQQAKTVMQQARASTERALGTTETWITGDSLAARLAFLILVAIVFVILLRIGSTILQMIFTPSQNPKVVSGMKDARKVKVVPQNPATKGSVPILRSRNDPAGISLTWTVWVFVDDLTYKQGQRKHIFHKGTDAFNNKETAYPNNAPGLYISGERNGLIVVMNTFENIMEEVEVSDIPLNKWINVAIRVCGRVMDVYINGSIAVRHIFKAVPKQNYGDVFVNLNGGFSGFLSDLWYHDSCLTGTEIMQIVRDGPDMTMNKSMDIFPPYFALQWFFEQDAAPPQPASHEPWPTDATHTAPYN